MRWTLFFLLVSQVEAGFISFTNGDFSDFVPTNSSGGGWTSSNLQSPGGHSASDGNPGGHFILEGGPSGFNTSDPTLEQLVTGLTIGAEYTITWDYAGFDVRFPFVPSFGVFVDEPRMESGAIFLGENESTEFVTESAAFVATATSHTIFFAGELDTATNGALSSSDVSYRIDNISIAQTSASPVPEPSSLMLSFLLGVTCVVPTVVRKYMKMNFAKITG